MENNLEVQIQKLPPEKQVPEKNKLEDFEKLFDFIGAITKPSKRDGRERSFAERAERAKMLRDLEKVNREVKKQTRDRGSENSEVTEELKMAAQNRKREIINRAKNLQEIGNQYQNQQEITVNMGALGEQKARIVQLMATKNEFGEKKSKGRHIFIVPGASNDIDCVGSFARELAISGNNIADVTVMAYPESYKGEVSAEFVKAVESTPSFEVHAEYFKKAILACIKDGEEIELVGHSMGGIIAQLMLTDREFREKVKRATIISPISSVNQSENEFNMGTLNELKTAMSRLLPRYSYTTGARQPIEEVTKEVERDNQEKNEHTPAVQLERREKIFASHMKKMLQKMTYWPYTRVKDGGTITYISAIQDKMTRAIDVFKKGAEATLRKLNPQIRIEEVRGGHMGAFVDPEETIAALNKEQSPL